MYSFYSLEVVSCICQCRYAGALMLDWQYVWIIWATNRLIMFSALLIVTVTWRPNDENQSLNQVHQTE